MKRIAELDTMKAIGILLVVIGHTTRMYTEAGLIKPMIGSGLLVVITKFIYLFHMPLFFFVSGCVLGYQEKRRGILPLKKKIIVKKIKRLIVPYVFFGFLYVAPFMFLFGYRNDFFSYAYHGILLCYDNRHLWYIISLFTIFMAVFFLNTVFHQFLLRKFTILCLSVIAYFLQDLLPTVFNIRLSAGFLLWFVLGYIFIDKTKLYSSILTIVSPFVFLILFWTIAHEANWLLSSFWIFMTLIIINSLYIFSVNLKRIGNCRILTYLGHNCFAIYLLHPILIYLFFHSTRFYMINPFIMTSCALMFSILGSMIIIYFIKNFKVTFVIGE